MEIQNFQKGKTANKLVYLFGLLLMLWMLPQSAFAHCDSYDGPVVRDAIKALENEAVDPVLKWIEPEYENEITALFSRTLKYKNGDPQVYLLLEKHFLETLVRIHREGEGEPYTGLKPAGATEPIIRMTDAALNDSDINSLLKKLNGHIETLIREKYEVVAALKDHKDESPEQGRVYVAAYVDYTHTIETLHQVLEHAAKSHKGHDL